MVRVDNEMTPSTIASATQTSPHSDGGRAVPRVLILRSCRPARLSAAVLAARARHPHAEIVALSHRGHAEELLRAGVDRVVEVGGRRFGAIRAGLATLWRLKRERFDEVLIPQMTDGAADHANLYRLVAAIGAPRVVIVAGDGPPIAFTRRTFRHHTLTASTAGNVVTHLVQGPLGLLGLLIASILWPRRPSPRGDRLRVLHVISSLGVGGAQRQLAELVNRLPEARYEVDILVLGRCDGDFSRQWFADPRLTVTYLDAWPRLVPSVLEIRRLCLARRYDRVHTWLFMANVIGVAGARLAGVPRVIASVRNLSLWKRTWYRQWWYRAADILSSRAADVVTVNARALADDHAAWAIYPLDRIRVVHNGLDPSQFLVDVRDARHRLRETIGQSEDVLVIGTTGRLAPEKDHVSFLRILHRVRDQHPDVHGVIVGDGHHRPQVEAAVETLGLAGSVTLLGERNDARRLLAGFDAFVLSSVIEGFPNVLLEAAFMGVPAIASRVGGNTDVLPDPVDTFAVGDIDAASVRLLTFLAAPEAAEAAARRARERALSTFTASRMAAAWCALYEQP